MKLTIIQYLVYRLLARKRMTAGQLTLTIADYAHSSSIQRVLKASVEAGEVTVVDEVSTGGRPASLYKLESTGRAQLKKHVKKLGKILK